MSRFSVRSYQKELIDDLHSDGPELKQTLKELKTINKLLGGNHVTTDGVKKLLRGTRQQKFTIADVGCGRGDMMRVMANWAKKETLEAEFIGIDANPNTIKLAENNLQDLSNVAFETANVFDTGFQEVPVDIITCSLFTHHFTEEELVPMFLSFRKKARIGLVINDLHRHPLAYHSIKILAGIFSKSKQVKNDGPLSVLRSFHKQELASILQMAGWEKFQITWHWAFRWQVICFK
ncbi:MAG: methyltransferase domain-containing protein [Anditalea sp.]